MKNGFRQCMAWLHTWTGLVVGWVLLFVFVTGTAAYASREVTRWMQPEQPLRVVSAPSAAEQFELAYQHLLSNPASQQSSSWTVGLVSDGRSGQQLTAGWSLATEPGQRGRNETVILDPASGEAMQATVEPRQTAGGRALVRMHYALHYLSYGSAIRIVGICTMIMFVALITGVITHKKIFKDFFTFRPGKGQRSWMDAHNMVSVIALPFFLMITYSGLLFFLYSYMPIGVPLAYGAGEGEQTYYSQLSAETGSGRLVGTLGNRGGGGGAPMTRQPGGQGGEPGGRSSPAAEDGGRPTAERQGRPRTAEQERGVAGEGRAAGGREGARGEPGAAPGGRGEAVAVKPLYQQAGGFIDIAALLSRQESEWGPGQVRAVSLSAGEAANPPRVQLSRAYIDVLRSRGGDLSYNALTGELIGGGGTSSPAADSFARSMLALHEGIFAKPLLRWFYLLSGLLGAAMIATGLVLWSVKRRAKAAKAGAWTFGHVLVEKLNIAAVAGLPFAMAAYFWANRLLPVTLEGRAAWEVHSLFIAWLFTLVYGCLRPSLKAWLEVLILAAAAYLLLPVLNALTTQRHMLATLMHRDWALFSIDAVFLALGLMFAWAAWKVHLRISGRVGRAQARPARVRRDLQPTIDTAC